MKRGALVLLKVAVSLGLLGYLFATTDLEALVQRVRTGDLLLLSAAVFLYAAMLGLSTWRWGLLLKAQGYPAPLRDLTASYLVATFFNNFLPSNIGGDVIRIRDGSRFTGSTTASVAIVAIDRILGFGALYFLAAAAFALGGAQVRQLAGARAVVLGLGVFFAVLSYVFFQPGTARRVMGATRLNRISWVRERFETVQAAVHVYRKELPTVFLALGASVTLQVLIVFYFFAIAHSLRIPLPLSACFLIVPLCTLVQAVPVSFNGWGIRESLFIVYFAQVGLSRDSALAFSLVGATLIVLLSLSGAVVWTTRRKELEAEG
jgi:uncharacterized protein (TIRG00374 family)